MKEVTAFFYRLRGYLSDPRSNGPELLLSVGMLLVVAVTLFVFYQWIRFKFVKRKYKALWRAQKADVDEKQKQEALDTSGDVSESDYRDPESIAEASGAGHLDPVSRGEVSESDAPDTKSMAGAIGTGFVRRQWRNWWLWLIIPSILLLLLALVITVPRYTMGKTSYCGTCHAMKNAVKSWRASNHSKVACQKCHELPGITGILMSQAQGLSNISLFRLYWRRHRPVTLTIPVSPGCLSCHEGIGKKIITYNDSIRISHKEFMYSVACEDCHPTAGHVGKKMKVRMMDKCVECHSENDAPVTCAICHEAEPTWSEQRLSSYAKATVTYRSCRKCHPTEMRCVQCHEKPQSLSDDDEQTF